MLLNFGTSSPPFLLVLVVFLFLIKKKWMYKLLIPFKPFFFFCIFDSEQPLLCFIFFFQSMLFPIVKGTEKSSFILINLRKKWINHFNSHFRKIGFWLIDYQHKPSDVSLFVYIVHYLLDLIFFLFISSQTNLDFSFYIN